MTEDELRALPKAEVHVHLEGCFGPDDVAELARTAGERRLARDLASLWEWDDLAGFLRSLDRICALVRTRDQLERAAYRFCEREAASGVVYADVTLNPTHWPAWRGRLDDMVDALDRGFREAERDGLPPAGLCLSLLRGQTAAEALELVDWILDRRHPRVVALSVDGNESAAGRTGPRLASAFEAARAAGLHRTVHAGESSGPEGVRDALDLLHAERIDHGVRAVEDEGLVAELAARRVPLGVCPHSNVALGLYPNRSSHPLDALRRAGVPVSINTDDPALFGVTLAGEYAAAAAAHGWDDGILVGLARTSLEAAFCDDDVREDALRALDRSAAPPA